MSTEVERDEEQQELSGEELGELLQIRRDKLSRLQSEGRDPFTVTKYDVTAYSQAVKDHFETMENQTVSMAGRVMSMRDMGKASFLPHAIPVNAPDTQHISVEVNGEHLTLTAVSMGNPHAVLFSQTAPSDLPIEEIARKITALPANGDQLLFP